MDNRVIIIGPLHHNTLGVVRSLGRVGLKNRMQLILCGNSPNFIEKSKYVKRNNIFYCKDYNSSVEILLSIRPKSNESKPIVICCSDLAISALDLSIDSLNPYFFIPNAKNNQGEITKLLEKNIQISLAKKCGLNVPETLLYKTGDDVIWSHFPCIIKPLDVLVGGKSDIIICDNNNDFERIIDDKKDKSLIIQPYIQKDFEYQIIGCSFGGEILIPGFTRILRQPFHTNTGYLIFDDINKLKFKENLVTKFIKSIGYSGLFSIEFLRDKDGVDYFLEINMRNDGNSYCVTSAGCNLHYLYYQWLSTGIVPQFKGKIKKTYFIPDFLDLDQARKQNVSIFKWFLEFLTADSHTMFSWNDWGPFTYSLNLYMKRIIKKIKK